MKRLVGVILCISVLMIACNKKNQQALTETNTQKDFPKTMYVNAADGLRVRNSPSSDGERIGLLNNLTEVTVTKEDNNTVNIGGTDGKWVYITEPIEGWVFNGFLSTDINTNDIRNKIIGNWIYYEVFCTFSNNGNFDRGVLESSSFESGYWELKENKIIINITHKGEDNGEWDVNKKEEYTYSFIDDDTIILTNNASKNTFIKFGKGRDIFGNYSANADYVWESYIEYRKRFPEK